MKHEYEHFPRTLDTADWVFHMSLHALSDFFLHLTAWHEAPPQQIKITAVRMIIASNSPVNSTTCGAPRHTSTLVAGQIHKHTMI